MLKCKDSQRQPAYHSGILTCDDQRQSSLEYYLLDFMENFDVYLFIVDPDYRRSLNDLLELFTDEEFDEFERSHGNRFVMN